MAAPKFVVPDDSEIGGGQGDDRCKIHCPIHLRSKGIGKKKKRFHTKNKHYCCNAPLNLAKFVFEPSYVQIYSKPSVFILNVFFHTIDS